MKLFNKLSLIALGAIMTVGVSVGASVGHDTVATYAADFVTKATFELGTNGSASHADGASKTTYTESNNGYTLNLTNGSQMYTGARDATGNSCVKFGSSKNIGYTTMSVPDDITQVTILLAKFKTDTSKVTIGSKTYSLTKNSNDGQYDTIVVDTSATKTIIISTTNDGKRAMMNTILFQAIQAGEGPQDTVKLDQTTLNLDLYGTTTATLTATTSGEGDVTWASSDTAVATVDNGLVTAVGVGETTISAKYNDVYATCVVTVVDTSIYVPNGNSFTKVTTEIELTDGNYLIVNEESGKAFNGGLSSLDVTSNYVTLEIEEDTISSCPNLENAIFSIAASGEKHSIKSASGKYIGKSATGNGLDTSNSEVLNTITFSQEGNAIITSSAGNTLQFNKTAGQERFRYFDTTQQPVALYKFVDSEVAEDAAAYATSFLDKTHTVCETTQHGAAGEAPQAMKDVWAELEEEYNALSDSAKDIVKTNGAVVARYSKIITKYTGLNDFLGTGVTALNNMTMFASNNANVNVMLLVAIATLVAFGLTVIVIRRRKHNA